MISNDQIKKDFRVFELDQRANDYLAQIVRDHAVLVRKDKEYPQLFLQEILQNIDLGKGNVITCLPQSIKDDSIYQFEYAKNNVKEVKELLRKGSIVTVESTSEWLVQIFKKYLDSNSNGTVLFKDINPLPTDPYISKIKEKILITDSEVFYFLTNKDSSVDKIKAVMKISDGAHPPLLAVCSILSESLSGGGKLSGVEIQSIVKNIVSIAIAAYDGDSYLVWNRQR